MKNSKKRNVYKNFFIYLIAILISTDLLFINLRIGFSKEIVKFVNNIHFMLIISIITFYVCTQIKKAKTIFSFLLIILLFAIPFAYYWSTGITTQKILGGLIPHRDSMYYYLEARNSLNGKLTSSMTAGRPIFSGFLAPLIALTQNNIQAVLVILALLCAISFYFIFYEAQVEFSPLPASLLMAGVYNFYARYIPHLVSEQLGMILSLTGWTLLLIGIRRENRKFLLLGILIMSIQLQILDWQQPLFCWDS